MLLTQTSQDTFSNYVQIIRNYAEIMSNYVVLLLLRSWTYIYNDVESLTTLSERTANERDCQIH